MIQETGLHFKDLEPETFDMPFGFKTGAGVIFGNQEAYLKRCSLCHREADRREAGELPIRERERRRSPSRGPSEGGGKEFSLAVVSGLGNARKLIERIKSGEAAYHLVEVMACPGGCIGGAGQPVSADPTVRKLRTKGIYENDRMLVLHKSQDNPYVDELYRNFWASGRLKAHELLHTGYRNRKRIVDEDVPLHAAGGTGSVDVSVCVGTSCFLKGSQRLLHDILDYLGLNNLGHLVNVGASFCFERCDKGPTVRIGQQVIERCTLDEAIKTIERYQNRTDRRSSHG